MTALGDIIKGMIAEDGPMPLDRYMTMCLSHPLHGYYMTRDPLGAAGDFTTSPEISQVFGELIGVWVAQVWQQLGSPGHFALVELGPGRGTLMADVIRVLTKIPGCRDATDVNLVETSPVLRDVQMERLPKVTWHSSVASLPALPTILLANEFFDALPIRQFEKRNGRVRERCVQIEGNELSVGLMPTAQHIVLPGEGVFEDASIRGTLATHLGNHLSQMRGAGLIIDYGHMRSAMGDTLQAMRGHAFCKITDHPGNADVTSHVDFESLGRAFEMGGAQVAGHMTQGEFLQAMGLEARTRVLAGTVSTEKQKQIIIASERLANPVQMGELFKVMAVTSGLNGLPYPF